jgi:hypothetical protein
MAASTETIPAELLPASEPMPAPRASDPGKAGKFKIGNEGTHATNGVSSMDTPKDDGPAEPAAAAPTEKTEPTEDKPLAPLSAEPAKTAPLASSLPATPAAPATPASPATPTATATPAEPAKPITLGEVLKAAGYDDAFIQMAELYKETGNITPFVQALGRDFTKMSDEQVLRESLVRDNPDATPEQLDILYESEIKDKYKLDPEAFDPNGKEAKAAKVRMELDAKRARATLIKENEKFKLPSRDVSAEATQRAQAAAQAEEQATNELLNQPYMKSVLTDKKVSFTSLNITDDKGNVTVIPDRHIEIADPTEIQRILTDGGKSFARYTTGPDGKRDSEALAQIAMFTMNRKAFVQHLINYGKSLGKEELIEEKSNPRQPGERSPATESKGTLKEAFKTGKHGTAG